MEEISIEESTLRARQNFKRIICPLDKRAVLGSKFRTMSPELHMSWMISGIFSVIIVMTGLGATHNIRMVGWPVGWLIRL